MQPYDPNDPFAAPDVLSSEPSARTSRSRRGVVAAILTGALAYRSRGRRQTASAVALVLFAVGGLVAWRGTDTLVDWYGNTSTLEWRFQLWKDTLPARPSMIRDVFDQRNSFGT